MRCKQLEKKQLIFHIYQSNALHFQKSQPIPSTEHANSFNMQRKWKLVNLECCAKGMIFLPANQKASLPIVNAKGRETAEPDLQCDFNSAIRINLEINVNV